MLFPLRRDRVQQRVVVTGAGLVTALGCGWNANTRGFREGQNAISEVTIFDVSRHRSHMAAQIDMPNRLPETLLGARTLRRLNRASQQLLHATAEAWSQADLKPQENLPLILGTTCCGMESGERYYRNALACPTRKKGQPTSGTSYQAHRQALDIAEAFGFRGPIIIIANACASGTDAIGHAWELVRSGESECVLAGGYDALNQLVYAGFDSLQALSSTICRPFGRDRDGLILGEGAAILVVESLNSATRRRADILGEIIGYSSAFDCGHLTQPHPQGDAALFCMKEACARAQVQPEDVGYINAHGTGTPLNDLAEAQAINRWAGRHVSHLAVSSTKGSVGHTLGAAGAVETVVCLMVLREQWLPPQRVDALDSVCAFPVVGAPCDAKVDVAISNSFGFGGANSTLVVRRWS